MKKFEYRQFTVETSGHFSTRLPETVTLQLNELGKDGWEFVQAVPVARAYGRTSSVTFIMRREAGT